MSSTWSTLADKVLAGQLPSRDEARAVLHAPADQLLTLHDAAFRVRRHHWGRRVSLHVLEAAVWPVGDPVAGGRRAPAARAKRYCMVTARRGPSQGDLETICEAAGRIKAEMDIELCASLGLLTAAKAQRLAAAGVDRFNHNLETSERHYDQIVSTHTWKDRVETVQHAKAAGMDTCCGGIVGLGESEDDLLDLAFALRDLDVDSVPVNFLDARPGTPLAGRELVEPGYALRALCMFRFVHPRTDLRVAGGREITLRALQAMALYPANSIFTQGYLTTGGATPHADHQMIKDAGFELELASGESVPADPEAMAALAAPARRPSLPLARS